LARTNANYLINGKVIEIPGKTVGSLVIRRQPIPNHPMTPMPATPRSL